MISVSASNLQLLILILNLIAKMTQLFRENQYYESTQMAFHSAANAL